MRERVLPDAHFAGRQDSVTRQAQPDAELELSLSRGRQKATLHNAEQVRCILDQFGQLLGRQVFRVEIRSTRCAGKRAFPNLWRRTVCWSLSNSIRACLAAGLSRCRSSIKLPARTNSGATI